MEDIQIITVCIVEMGYFAEYVENTIMIDGDTNHEPLVNTELQNESIL